MNVAMLNEMITIQQSSVYIDEIGNHTTVWKDYLCCHATVCDNPGGGANGYQNDIAGIITDVSDLSFTVRYCVRTANVDMLHFRILFRGDLYDIVSVDHMNYKKKCIKYRCKKVDK